ncbi:endoplasmic reticulum aminopeptidase 2-like [Lytechinus pictus]|uniref:endoplasmic reticulum aminopeptidase 2-like n=1 Tax=Lytechinus pictus TaxID=7653 RepID=UPI00240D88B9|nr:endoplasmic reticulum aminopeptidase 2-like [Lytechinus pictus]
MTSYRQLQSDDVSDQFDLDSQPDAFKPRGEVEVQIEPTKARTKSRVRLPNTSCTKNKVIIVLVIMLLILVLVASLTIYELDKHGVQCHNEAQENKATTNPTTEPPTTASTSTTTKVATPATTQAVATNGETFPWTNIRLPSSAIPFEYAIFLHPNLSSFEVQGNVSIHFNAKEEVSFIILHAKDMDILKPESIELVDHLEPSVDVEKLLINKKHDQISIEFEKPIGKDVHCILTLEFNYTLAEGLDGFYRSSYKKNGQSV